MRRTILLTVSLVMMAAAAVAQSQRTFRVSDFKSIQFDAVGKVEFTQGPISPIIVTGTAAELNDIEIKLKKDTLIISTKLKKQRTYNNNGPHFVISVPVLEKLSIDGVCTFNAKQIDNKGDFRLQVGGVASINIQKLKCQNFISDIDGVVNNSLCIEASQQARFRIGGVTNGSTEIQSDVLRLDIDGVDHIDYTFHGREAHVDCNGVGKNSLTVDCQILHARAEGVSTMTLRGTADEVDFGSEGVSQFNATNLNKF